MRTSNAGDCELASWLGVTAYHMLAGRPPFEGDTPLAVAMKHVNQPPRPVAELRTNVPADLASGAGAILVRPVTALDIASSTIRELIADGRDPRFLVPEAVRAIIQRTGCYAASCETEYMKSTDRRYE